MISFYTIIIFLLSVFFVWLTISNVSHFWKYKEPFVFIPPYDENAKGDKEDVEDDAFFKKMNAEFRPVDVSDIDNMVFELDEEVELSPEETDFIDGEDIELPENPRTSFIATTSKLPKRIRRPKQDFENEDDGGEDDGDDTYYTDEY